LSYPSTLDHNELLLLKTGFLNLVTLENKSKWKIHGRILIAGKSGDYDNLNSKNHNLWKCVDDLTPEDAPQLSLQKL